MLESTPFIKTHSLSTESSKAEALSAGLSRRQTLKWMGVVAAGVTLPMLSGCEDVAISAVKMAGHWPDLKLPKITGEGYGQDPNLISPLTSPWPPNHEQKAAPSCGPGLRHFVPSRWRHAFCLRTEGA